MLNQPGVYTIKNSVSGKIYVGSSARVSSRLSQHRWALKRGDHVNKKLQSSWDKHGEVAFLFSTLEECGHGELLDRETWWIRHLNSDGPLGFNLVAPIRGVTPNPGASEERKSRWKDLSEEERKSRSLQLTADAVRKGNSERQKERWKDPEYRAKRLEGLARGRAITNARKDPKILANLAIGRAKAHEQSRTDPLRKQKQRELVLAQWDNPIIRASRMAVLDRGREALNLRKKAAAKARCANNDIVSTGVESIRNGS